MMRSMAEDRTAAVTGPTAAGAGTGAAADPSGRPAAEVAAELGVDPEQGLSSAEAAARLAAHGPNELTGTPPTPWWRRLGAQFTDPLIVLLLVAVVISLVAWVVEWAEGVPFDAVVILAIIVTIIIVTIRSTRTTGVPPDQR